MSFDRREASYTVFDYKKRTIYIHESSGCCSYYEIWAKSFNDPYLNKPNIKVVKQVEHEWRNGSMRGNLFSTNNTKLNDTTSTNKIYLSTNNTKWTIYRYTRFTIYIVKFVCFVLKNIVKFVLFVLKIYRKVRDIRAAILPARIKYI